jgi:hypothetical protein
MEPVAEQFVAEPQPAPAADPEEAEHPTPMGLFDSIEPAPERRKAAFSTSAEDEAEEPAPRSWFQRIFQRDAEPVVSFLPGNDDDDDDVESIAEPAAAMRATTYDESRFDLPLPVEAAPEPSLVHAPEPTVVPEPVVVHTPLAQVVEDPLPDPVVATPAPVFVRPAQPAAAVREPAVAFKQPAAPEPEPTVYAFKAAAVASAPAPAVTPANPAPAAYALSQAAVVQAPVQRAPLPVSPLSYAELLKLQPAPGQAAVAQPAVAQPAPEPFAETPVEPVVVHTPLPEPTPAPTYDDWNPAPLNRWDPIPPLRQQEPWRISSGSTRAAQQQSAAEVWRGEDPVRIAPTDRWVSADAIAPEAPPAESNDVVLTRRWGLLSRFQQGESFQAAHRAPEPVRQQKPARYADDELTQDFGQDYDPEYDRSRR